MRDLYFEATVISNIKSKDLNSNRYLLVDSLSKYPFLIYIYIIYNYSLSYIQFFWIENRARDRESYTRRDVTEERCKGFLPRIRRKREREKKTSAKCISSQAHGDRLLNKCDRMRKYIDLSFFANFRSDALAVSPILRVYSAITRSMPASKSLAFLFIASREIDGDLILGKLIIRMSQINIRL